MTSRAWHRTEAAGVLDSLGSSERGLSVGEAAARRRRYGDNALLVAPPTPWWRVLARQLSSLIVLLLTVAAVGAWLVGEPLEAAAIAVVLLLNTSLGFAMEMWARQAMDSLRNLEVQQAVVRRDGETRVIDSRDLVPGDIVLIEAGGAIPADARLLSSTELSVVEAPLTGESQPVHKNSSPLEGRQGEIPLAERNSMVYKGTLAAAGSAEAVVVATGGATEIGRIAAAVLESPGKRSPLERRLDVLGRRLVWIALGIAGVVAALGVLRGEAWWLMVETGIALSVAAIPEGLPVVATITLALGMRRMARRQALVRRLADVETLGSATVVCADKTGTLTAAEMTVTVVRLWSGAVEVSGSGYVPEGHFLDSGAPIDPLASPDLRLALEIGMLVNRADLRSAEGGVVANGDPTEAAMLVCGQKAGLERREVRERLAETGQIPFSSERMLMATFHRSPEGRRYVYVKGALDRLIDLSGSALEEGERVDLDAARHEQIRRANRDLAGDGLRVLALAFRELEEGEPADESVLRDLCLVGLIGITDPPAPLVKETVAGLARAGVRTVMITGDQSLTALAVGRELGLVDEPEEVVEGVDLQRETDQEIDRRLDRVGVFSRVSPADKLRIVEAFQRRGEIVAMLGDGVNDAPALKRADIGVAMGGRGTDVAKETAGLVLRDDRFETLYVAVKEGRIIFDNIRKFVFYLFSCNLAEVLVLFLAGLSDLPLPLLPLQILWLNLVTDVFPALALAAEPPEPGVMRRPPRDPRAALLSGRFLRLTGLYGLILAAATLGVFLWSLEVWKVEANRAVTLAFMTLALSQLMHVFNARSESAVVFSRRLFASGWVWGAIALTVGLQLAAVYQPDLSRVLQTTSLDIRDWTLIAIGSLIPLVLGQLWKIGRQPRDVGVRGTL